MTDYTPTPWAYACEPNAITGRPFGAIWSEAKGRSGDILYITLNPDQIAANAAFIVKAVNAHDTLVTELKLIADWRNVNLAGEYEHSLRDIIRSMLDCADRALASIKVPS